MPFEGGIQPELWFRILLRITRFSQLQDTNVSHLLCVCIPQAFNPNVASRGWPDVPVYAGQSQFWASCPVSRQSPTASLVCPSFAQALSRSFFSSFFYFVNNTLHTVASHSTLTVHGACWFKIRYFWPMCMSFRNLLKEVRDWIIALLVHRVELSPRPEASPLLPRTLVSVLCFHGHDVCHLAPGFAVCSPGPEPSPPLGFYGALCVFRHLSQWRVFVLWALSSTSRSGSNPHPNTTHWSLWKHSSLLRFTFVIVEFCDHCKPQLPEKDPL